MGMRYNKLVRDRIPDIIRARGKTPIVHIADEAEYWKKLKEKLFEEAKEFDESETPEEMADILEVIHAIIACKRWDREMLREIQYKKASERGRFEKRIILDEA